MDNEKDFWFGYVLGVVIMLIVGPVFDHVQESSCQTENNVSDCTWVLVPTLEKE
jgi:hypothetical protein